MLSFTLPESIETASDAEIHNFLEVLVDNYDPDDDVAVNARALHWLIKHCLELRNWSCKAEAAPGWPQPPPSTVLADVEAARNRLLGELLAQAGDAPQYCRCGHDDAMHGFRPPLTGVARPCQKFLCSCKDYRERSEQPAAPAPVLVRSSLRLFDVVMLKTGSPEMMVSGIRPAGQDGEPIIECRMGLEDGTGRAVIVSFRESMLCRVEATAKPEAVAAGEALKSVQAAREAAANPFPPPSGNCTAAPANPPAAESWRDRPPLL